MFTNYSRQSIPAFSLQLIISLILLTTVATSTAQYNPTYFKQSETKEAAVLGQSYASAIRMPKANDDSTGVPKIELKKKFFGSQKFVYDGGDRQNVYNFLGITFKDEFKEVMSLHPPALREVKRAYPYNALNAAGQIGMLGLTLKNLIDTINKAQKVSDGQLVSDGFELSFVIQVAVAGAITIVSGIIGSSHLKKGVEIFNERQERQLITSREPILSEVNQRQLNNLVGSNKGLKIRDEFRQRK